MARALALAEAGRYSTHPNPRVGCVIVKDGRVLGEGAHLQAGEPHAEVHALRQAGAAAWGAEVFVTLEPCNHHGRTPPCVEALIAAGVAKVWAAMVDPNPLVAGAGLARLQAAGIATETGLMQAEAEALNRGFSSRMRRQRPFVTLKLAASLDGRTAMASGESRWITGAAARVDVHRLRAEAGAVLTSAATVLADDPALTVRDFAAEGWLRQPDRIVLDRAARTPSNATVWQPGARRFWLTAQEPQAIPEGVERLAIPEGPDTASFTGALAALAAQQVNHVLVECGPRLAGSLLGARLVDELVVYLAPSLLGHEGRPLAALTGLATLDQRIALDFTDLARVGDDVRLTATLRS
jgi:diaminohydroxyphosphoribosylaminopyrimidine deaminase/5-amino-6-(5-phosphoribosylamino)uracil reductase